MKKFFILISAFLFLLTSCTKSALPQESEKIITAEKRIIAVWLNYNEISEIVKESESEEQFNQNIRRIIISLKEYSVNTLFLHTRAFDDCFYISSQFPVSEYCADVNGKLKFDVLKAFLEAAHNEGIEVHAWINPYRIRNDNDISKVPDGFLPKNWYYENKENQRLIICENGIYYNPASVEAQNHIIGGIKEVLEKYEVDGIHFDDYFYPETSSKIDSNFYSDYLKRGGNMSLEEYRRQCVNSLVAAVYSLIKSYDESLCFSVSPSGGIDDNLNINFADVRLWCSKKGYVDWIIPQVYYGFNNEKYPFKNTVEEWKVLVNEDIKLIIGLPLYKTGKFDAFAGVGSNEWTENSNIISKQISYIQNNKIEGISFYSAESLYSENLSEICKTELQNIKIVLK